MNSAIYIDNIDISWSIHLNKHDEGSPQMTVNCSWPWSYINIFLMIKYLIFEILPSEKHCCCKVVLLCCPLVNFLFENFALEILWTNEWKWCNAMMCFPSLPLSIPSMGFSHSIFKIKEQTKLFFHHFNWECESVHIIQVSHEPVLQSEPVPTHCRHRAGCSRQVVPITFWSWNASLCSKTSPPNT